MSRPGLLVQTAPPSSTSSKTLPKIPSEAIYAGTDFYFQKRHIFKDVSSGPNCINICAFSEKPALRVNKALAAERREQRSPSHWTAAFSALSRERKKEKVEAKVKRLHPLLEHRKCVSRFDGGEKHGTLTQRTHTHAQSPVSVLARRRRGRHP